MSNQVKIPGYLFKRFYTDAKFWPEDGGDTFHDDTLLAVNGVEHPNGVDHTALKDSDEVTVVYGGVVEGRGNGVGLDEYYLQWVKEQAKAATTASFLVTCPADKEAELKAAILALGLGAVLQ